MYLVSSDGCSDVYPENKPESFKIMLKDPLNFPEYEEWEVGLLDFHYPYSWANIGPRAQTNLYYYYGGEVHKLNIPDWHCEGLNDLVSFMQSEMPSDFEPQTDALGRFILKSKKLFCEVGMNERMMHVLGLDKLKDSEKKVLTEHALRKRAYLKQCMRRFWISEDPLEVNEAFTEEVADAIDDYVKLASLLREHLNINKLKHEKLPIRSFEKSEKGLDILKNVLKIAEALKLESHGSEFVNNFAFFHHSVAGFCDIDKPPKQIISFTRGNLSDDFEQLFVHSNIVEPVDVNDRVSDILRVVKSHGELAKTTQEVFSRPVYQQVKKGGKICTICIDIKTRHGELVPFVSGTTALTLHFRKRRN